MESMGRYFTFRNGPSNIPKKDSSLLKRAEKKEPVKVLDSKTGIGEKTGKDLDSKTGTKNQTNLYYEAPPTSTANSPTHYAQ